MWAQKHDGRVMLPHTRLLIHDPSYGSNDIGGQKSHEIQQQLDKLNEVRETLAKIIAEKTGKRLKEIYKVTANGAGQYIRIQANTNNSNQLQAQATPINFYS